MCYNTIMINLIYEYKLKPTKAQIAIIENTLSVCRKVWNYALSERKAWISSRSGNVNSCSINSEYILPADLPFPNYHVQAKALTKARKEISELKNTNSQVLQQVLRTLDRAWDDMLKRNFGFPRFKNQVRMRSFLFPQFKTNPFIDGKNKIKLPKLGLVKYYNSRDIPEGFKVKQVRIVRRASGYYMMVAIAMDADVPTPIYHGHVLGIDIGLDYFVATSDSELIERPRFFKSLHRKLKLLQRRLKFKQLGSNSRNKLNKKIAKLHEKISNTRCDFHFKTAHQLCKDTGAIFVEDINFKAWSRNMLCKHNLDAGFGQFFEILEYVCWKTDTYFAKVNKDYTSQTCPNCNKLTGKKDLSVRVHSCVQCGYTTNRDVAAAQVIRNRGVNAVGMPVLENAS